MIKSSSSGEGLTFNFWPHLKGPESESSLTRDDLDGISAIVNDDNRSDQEGQKQIVWISLIREGSKKRSLLVGFFFWGGGI